MRSPNKIGAACAKPGIGVCHRTFLPVSTFHSVGSGLLASTPEACGPRNCGQSAAARRIVVSVITTAVIRRRLVIARFPGRNETGALLLWQAAFGCGKLWSAAL